MIPVFEQFERVSLLNYLYFSFFSSLFSLFFLYLYFVFHTFFFLNTYFLQESVIECLRDYVILRELNSVQEELRKESEKRIAQKKLAIEQKEKQKAEDEEAAAAFQSKFGRKKEEKVSLLFLHNL